MSTHLRDGRKAGGLKREYDDGRRKDSDRHTDRRRDADERRRGGERRRERRDSSPDRRSYQRRDYDDRPRGEDREPDRESRRDRIEDRDYHDRRHHEPRRERERPSRRSASPGRPSRSPARSKSPADKAKPNFKPSGLLAAATNTVKTADGTSTLLKYNEPPEARKPTLGWRLYVFKGTEQTELLHIHQQSAYLIGRDRTVADIFIEHPSCSKQHAVIQHRQVQERDELGGTKQVSKPFIIDLESTNATHVNGETIPTTRYYELRAGDVIKFGLSNREYVLLHDESA